MSNKDVGRKVTVIPAKPEFLLFSEEEQAYRKKRVAAYARVSTDDEEQQSSYEAQVDYYTRYIKSNSKWEFVDIYSDEGISGTNTKRRDGFNRMIADALDGKIDLILTKSISRFARNTVDTLTTVRKLKDKNIEVFFEKENIYTLDSKGELLITIMSSLAQEESRSMSENITWGIRKSMEDGKTVLRYNNFLGYEKGEDGRPRIVESEAEVIRRIYRLYIEGRPMHIIAQILTDDGILTPAGKPEWSLSTVRSILSNEKYRGSALLQKTYTVDYLNKTKKKNEGEIPQYYIENSHPAIIPRETFDFVQSEMKRRYPLRRQINKSIFSARIICGDCGGFYGARTWHSNTPYCNRGWLCNRKYARDKPCNAPRIREHEIEQAFVQAFNMVVGDKNAHIDKFELLLPSLTDVSKLEGELKVAKKELYSIERQLGRYIEENARQPQDQVEYNKIFGKMSDNRLVAKKKVEEIEKEVRDCGAKKETLGLYLEELRRTGDIVTEFDESQWLAVCESVTIHPDKSMTFRFRDGSEIKVSPEKK